MTYYSKNNQSLEKPPRDVVESPAWEVFEICLDRMLDNLIYAPFSHERLDLMIFGGSFQPRLFYDSMKNIKERIKYLPPYLFIDNFHWENIQKRD